MLYASHAMLAFVAYLNIDGKRHNQNSYHDICHSKRNDEVVGYCPKVPFAEDARTDEAISGRREDRKYEQQQRPVLRVLLASRIVVRNARRGVGRVGRVVE